MCCRQASRVWPLLLPALLCLASWGADLPRAVMLQDAALLPLRVAAEWCGARVSYNEPRAMVTLQWQEHVCGLPLAAPGLGTALVDGHDVAVVPAPRIVDGALYVPASFLARVFDSASEAVGEYVTLRHPARDETFTFLATPRVLLAAEFLAAIEAKDAVRARLLLDIDARLSEARKTGGATPLHLAASRDGALTTLLLTAGAPVAVQDTRGWTPLHVAAQVGPADAVTALLKAGADRAAQTPAGETPLALARAAGRAEIVALLELPR